MNIEEFRSTDFSRMTKKGIDNYAKTYGLTQQDVTSLCITRFTEEEIMRAKFSTPMYSNPIREQAEHVAKDPNMNLLLMQEATAKYRTILSSKGGLDKETIEDKCAENMALPIKYEARVLKIQAMFEMQRTQLED